MSAKTHRPNRQSRHTSDRGAILIMVAAASLVLIAFTMFVVDYGVLWVGRRQAQNSADAGAMAGAVALAFDNATDQTDTGPAKVAANTFALANNIWGEDPVNDISADVTFPPCPDDGSDTCIRVDVFRNQNRGNPLPMMFGLFVGLSQQGVRATATAQAAFANASDCLKPFAVPDKWQDNWDETAPIDGVWAPDDAFERTTADTGGNQNNATPLATPDVYIPPSASSPGTGYTVTADYGIRITLKAGGPQDALNPSFYFPVRLPMPGGGYASGANDYSWNIANCNGVTIEVPTTLESEPGNMVGPTAHGMEDLIALDPLAYWSDNGTPNYLADDKVANSCANATPSCGPRSPRIVAVPIFDTQAYWDGKVNGVTTLNIVNVLGFFAETMNGNEVTGVLTTVPGMKTASSGLNSSSSFMRTVQLVR